FFCEMYADAVRHDHRRGRWLNWGQQRWKPDADGEVQRLALNTVRERLKRAADIDNDDSRKAAAAWALKSESRGKLDALLCLAQNLRPIASAGDNWDCNPWLICTPAGVIDLRIGKIRPGAPSDHITMSTSVPCDFGPPKRWLQFLNEIFDDNEDLVN